jgi:signal transduction histidine kinase
MTLLIVLVILASMGVVAYVQLAVKQVEEELPLRVMREKRDMERIARNFYDFIVATDAARVHPTQGNVESVHEHLQIVTRALERLRDRYAFNTLIGASALHSVLSPTVDDVQIWLEGGFGNLPPSSPIVLELVANRARDTLSRIFDKTTEADRIAYEILEHQTGELQQLRRQLLVPLIALVLLAAGMVWLASRQQRVAARQAEAEAAKERAQTQLRHAIESISEGFSLFDADDRLVISNDRLQEFLYPQGTSPPKPGTTFETIIRNAAEAGLIEDVHDYPTVEDWVEARLAEHHEASSESIQRRANGKWIRITERTTEDGGHVAVYSDITELKEREQELQLAHAAAMQASEAKGAFLANVSHELRTPLTSILGFTRMNQRRLDERVLPALETEDPKIKRGVRQISENTEIILAEGARLTALINNVLDLAKIEAGEMDWDISPLHPGELIERAVAATEFLPREKGLELSVDVATDLPAVLGDGDKVVQVIVNLVSNATKFTDQGSITCRARLDGEGTIDFSVSDTGCGIAEGDQGVVFEQFRQVGDTLTDKPTGTGLGLPICKEIVDHLGGRIWVESKLNEGSTFHFTLPPAP